MVNQVMIIKNSRPEIGLYTRPATPGDEYDLVEQFIEYYCHIFSRNNKKTKLAVFIEPRIDSGFPDIVFASYLPSITEKWTDKREGLDDYDLKLLAYLCHKEGATGAKLVSVLGFPEKQTLTSIEKLMAARLISYRGGSWRAREIRDIFSLTKLVAVEAKLKDISKVIEQTHVNTRFASHSYALTSSAHPQAETVRRFRRFGLGLYGRDSQFRRLVEAKPFALPSSHLSFQFNEWIGKILAGSEEVRYA